MSTFVVGVSGGIGSGKTTVTDLFAQKGIQVIDADLVARKVVEPGTKALQQIVEKFGGDILSSDSSLDRAKLRTIIFAEPELKTWLNNLLHPIIRQTMQQQTEQATSVYCLLSAPLLVENNLHTQVDRVLIVDVEEDLQLARTVRRDNTNELQVKAIITSQVSREKRLSVADDVINNNHGLAALIPQVERLHKQYLQLAEKA